MCGGGEDLLKIEGMGVGMYIMCGAGEDLVPSLSPHTHAITCVGGEDLLL